MFYNLCVCVCVCVRACVRTYVRARVFSNDVVSASYVRTSPQSRFVCLFVFIPTHARAHSVSMQKDLERVRPVKVIDYLSFSLPRPLVIARK